MKNLSDFKRAAQVGAKFRRRLPDTTITDKIVTVGHVQTNAIAFPPGEATEAWLLAVKRNPQKNGSWFYWPKHGSYRIENGELIVYDTQKRDYFALKLVEAA